jgi:hypothetical protein
VNPVRKCYWIKWVCLEMALVKEERRGLKDLLLEEAPK